MICDNGPGPGRVLSLVGSATMVEIEWGLDLNAAGADTWQSAGISTQLNVAGDFDVRIEFDTLKLAVPSPGQQSGLHFQIDPVTARPLN